MRSTIAALALVVLATAACAPDRRDVQINWTFGTGAGQSCSAAGVATIEIDIGGLRLYPNQFDCAGSSATGVDLGNLIVGDYGVIITGLDSNGNPLFQTEPVISVVSGQNPNVFNFVVPPVSAEQGVADDQGELTLLWTFNGQSCADAGVSTVTVTLDGTAVTYDNDNAALPCDQFGVDGISIDQIAAGAHSVVLAATGTNSTSYTASFNANIADQFETQLSENLTSAGNSGGTTASAELSWSFAGMSCSDAKVDTVGVTVDGTSAGSFPCTASGVDGATVTGLTAGSHAIAISAVRGSGSAAELVYDGGSTASFLAGDTTHLLLDAPATAPGVGGVTLTLSFPSGGPSCAAGSGAGTSVSYTLTSPAGVTGAAQTFLCGGSSGGASISICDPGTAGCGAGNAGLAAGVWTISASATGYSASQPFSVPNDAVGAATVSFTAE